MSASSEEYSIEMTSSRCLPCRFLPSLRICLMKGGSENTFAYVSLPSRLAKRITAQLNLAGPSRLVPTSAYAWQDDEQVDRIYNRWLSSQWHEHSVINALQNGHGQVAFSTHSNLTLGYVTRDACPGLGDDIEHIPGEPSVRSMLMSARSVPHSNLQP